MAAGILNLASFGPLASRRRERSADEMVRRPRLGLASKFVLSVGLIGAVTMASITFYMYQGSASSLIAREQVAMSSSLDIAALRLQSGIESAREDALFLSLTPPILGIERGGNRPDPFDSSSARQWRDRLGAIFSAIMQTRSDYYQVRYIGVKNGGREIVRVDRSSDGRVWQTPDDELQVKAGRPYFQETIQLEKGEIYTSRIDLNREHGQIERPYRPVIRIATPAYDVEGELHGVVVINVDMAEIFKSAAAAFGPRDVQYVTNSNGDYLDHPDSTRTFGFDLGHRYRVQDDLPDLNAVFAAAGAPYRGIIDQSEGRYLATARRIEIDSRDPHRFLVIANLKPQAELLAEMIQLRDHSILASLLMLTAALAAVAWITRLLTGPLNRIGAAAWAITRGAKDIDLEAMTQHSDETGELARAFQIMAAKVRAREAELTQRADELNRSNQELSQFAYVASHDLQEPLRMVSSYLGLLSRRYGDKLDAEADEFIGYAVDGAERMKQLINDLLGYSRVSNEALHPDMVDAASIVNQVTQTLASQIEECGAVIEIGPLPTLRADPVMMERLFRNLLDNALKYRSSSQLRVQVLSEGAGDFWQFSVIDNGIGIDAKFFDKIFEIFTRLHSRESYSGTGIGLAGCKRIVERHGGKLWVEAAPRGGSIFRFTLPGQSKGT